MRNANVGTTVYRTITICAAASLLLALSAQAQGHVAQSFTMPVEIKASLSLSGCNNSPGPQITLTGGIKLGGLSANMIFRNNQIVTANNPVGGPHEAVVTTDVTLISSGVSLKFPKQPVLGGVGGNPWISVQFEQSDGTAIGSEDLLGRCVQLSK